MDTIKNNVIPYDDLKYLFASYAPLLPFQRSYHKSLSVIDITHSAFQASSLTIKSDFNEELYMGCCMMYVVI
jgi:hypothetical protein